MPNILFLEKKTSSWASAVDSSRYTILKDGTASVSVNEDFTTTDIIIPNELWAYTTKTKNTAYPRSASPEFDVKLRKGVYGTSYDHAWTKEELESYDKGNLQRWDFTILAGNLTLRAIDLAADGQEGAVSTLLDFLTEHDGVEFEDVIIL